MLAQGLSPGPCHCVSIIITPTTLPPTLREATVRLKPVFKALSKLIYAKWISVGSWCPRNTKSLECSNAGVVWGWTEDGKGICSGFSVFYSGHQCQHRVNILIQNMAVVLAEPYSVSLHFQWLRVEAWQEDPESILRQQLKNIQIYHVHSTVQRTLSVSNGFRVFKNGRPLFDFRKDDNPRWSNGDGNEKSLPEFLNTSYVSVIHKEPDVSGSPLCLRCL